jgi:hypothetical protein
MNGDYFAVRMQKALDHLVLVALVTLQQGGRGAAERITRHFTAVQRLFGAGSSQRDENYL